jgi:2'-5' RNA ligase
MKRIFIAVKVEPQDSLKRMFSSLKAISCGDIIKWTDPDNIHLTLAFLGDTEDIQIVTLSRILLEKCERSGRFELIIKGAGVFKSFKDPRVVWTGIVPSEELLKLHGIIKDGLSDAGIKTEERPFRPHLTLGRIKYLKPDSGLKEMIDRYKETEFQKVSVSEVTLFESILLQKGAVYKPVVKFKL